MVKCAFRETTTTAYSTLNFNLEQQIAKQEERLKQLKAQKQAVLAREKKNSLNSNGRKILDVKSYRFFSTKENEDEEEKAKYSLKLNEYLTEDRDRKLFDFDC